MNNLECLGINDVSANRLEHERTPFENRVICRVFVNEKGRFLLKDLARQDSHSKELYDFPIEKVLLGETSKEAFSRHTEEDFKLLPDEDSVQNAGEMTIEYPDRTDNMQILVCGLSSSTHIEGYGKDKWWFNLGKLKVDSLSFETEQVLEKLADKETKCLAARKNREIVNNLK